MQYADVYLTGFSGSDMMLRVVFQHRLRCKFSLRLLKFMYTLVHMYSKTVNVTNSRLCSTTYCGKYASSNECILVS